MVKVNPELTNGISKEDTGNQKHPFINRDSFQRVEPGRQKILKDMPGWNIYNLTQGTERATGPFTFIH